MKTEFLIRLIQVNLCLLFALNANAQTIRHVKPTAIGTGDGSSWINASASIQDMLGMSAHGDEVWVAAGTYYPTKEPDGTTDNPRDFTFHLANGVKLYGGFAGNETSITQRELVTNLSALNGDVGANEEFSDNCHHVVLTVNDDSTTRIDGFSILNGNANIADSIMTDGIAVSKNKGGGICSYFSSVAIENIRQFNCVAMYGGGVYNNASSSRIINSIFEWNVAAYGGGMFNENTSALLISNSSIDSNSTHMGTTADGGAMYNLFSTPTIINTKIFDNTSSNGTGGVYNIHSSPVFSKSFFLNNRGNGLIKNGGGMYNIYSSPIISNSVFFRNGSQYCGGMCNDSSSSPIISNCTFWNGAAESNGCDGILNLVACFPVIKNSIMLNRRENILPWSPPTTIADSSSSLSTITYSNISGGFSGTANVDTDPSFINMLDLYGTDNVLGTADDGLRLRGCSPLINAGDNNAVSGTDISGAARVQLGVVDMGAYESSSDTIDNPASISMIGREGDTTVSSTLFQASDAVTVYANDCTSLIAVIKGGGSAGSASDSVTATVWSYDYLYDANNIRLVPRHYEILPASNAVAAAAKVTLYFTQMDLDVVTFFWDSQFNLSGLPIAPNDANGKSNLRVLKYNGSSNDGTGLPSSYNNGSTIIDPIDSNILWNAAQNRWEISFDVTGFGGFFVERAALAVVPVKWININATLNLQKHAAITWKVQEQNTISYTIQESLDGIHFSDIGIVVSKGNGEQNYSFTKPIPQTVNCFYRIKQISKDGIFSYSTIINLQYNNSLSVMVNLYPNPVNEQTSISVTLNKKEKLQYRLTDITGRVMLQKDFQVGAGNTVVPLPVAKFPAGIYYLLITGESFTKQIAMLKE